MIADTVAAFQIKLFFLLLVVPTADTLTPLQRGYCCTQYAYNRDELQVRSLIRTPVVPRLGQCAYHLLQMIVGQNNPRLKHAGFHTARRDLDVVKHPGSFGILLFP